MTWVGLVYDWTMSKEGLTLNINMTMSKEGFTRDMQQGIQDSSR